jgi:hypothetical protein
MRSQIVISKGKGGRRYRPYAFTEHGAIMSANGPGTSRHRCHSELVEESLSFSVRRRSPDRAVSSDRMVSETFGQNYVRGRETFAQREKPPSSPSSNV